MKILITKAIIAVFITAILGMLITTFVFSADEPENLPPSITSQEIEQTNPEQSQPAQDQVTCMGTVVAEKNWLGMTKGFLLRKDDGEQYVVSKDGMGRQIQSMVGRRIEATGALEETTGNRKTIRVLEFKEIKPTN